MTFDEKLSQALEESFDERMEQRLAVTKKHRFSLAYKLWEHKTLNSLKKNRYNSKLTLKRTRLIVFAVIAVAALLVGTTSCLTVFTSIRRFNFKLSTNDYRLLRLETIPSDKTSFEEFYVLSEGNGCQLLDDLTESIGKQIEHSSGYFGLNYEFNGNYLKYTQETPHMGFRNYYIALEDKLMPISLYEMNDGFFVERCENSFFKNTLCWIYDGYYFEIIGDFTKEEAVNLALSTKIVDFSEIM